MIICVWVCGGWLLQNFGRRWRRKRLLFEFSRGTKLTFGFSESKRRNVRWRKKETKKNEQLVTLFSSLHTLPRHGEVCGLSGNAKAAQKSCAEKKNSVNIQHAVSPHDHHTQEQKFFFPHRSPVSSVSWGSQLVAILNKYTSPCCNRCEFSCCETGR